MLVHLIYTPVVYTIGFVIGCIWTASRLGETIKLYEQTVMVLSEENAVLHAKLTLLRNQKPRVYRTHSETLTDDESDQVWEEVMGKPPWEMES